HGDRDAATSADATTGVFLANYDCGGGNGARVTPEPNTRCSTHRSRSGWRRRRCKWRRRLCTWVGAGGAGAHAGHSSGGDRFPWPGLRDLASTTTVG
ncbi:unnamed protein product, partial [Ectocarpus fasciculatus]